MSIRVVLVGGAQDGLEFHVPDDDPIVTRGELAMPAGGPSPAGAASEPAAGSASAPVHYLWDGTTRDDGARRYRPGPTR